MTSREIIKEGKKQGLTDEQIKEIIQASVAASVRGNQEITDKEIKRMIGKYAEENEKKNATTTSQEPEGGLEILSGQIESLEQQIKAIKKNIEKIEKGGYGRE